MSTIKIKRLYNQPSSAFGLYNLAPGELGYTGWDNRLYIGNAEGNRNILINDFSDIFSEIYSLEDEALSEVKVTVENEVLQLTFYNIDGKQVYKLALDHVHSNYVNQNAFGEIHVNDTVITADEVVDTLSLIAGDNIVLTADTTDDKITIKATDTTYTLSNTTGTNPTVKLTDNNENPQNIQIVGSGATTVTGENGKITISSTDNNTKNTAGSTNTSSKIFLVGATSQAANPQTYSHDTVYVDTDGHLYDSNNRVVTKPEFDNLIPFINGTQTAATNVLKGDAPFSTLVHGQTIRYRMPFDGKSSTNATLEISDPNGTSLGVKNCYYKGATRLTTQYKAGDIILFTYLENVTIGTGTYSGWWAHGDYNSDANVKQSPNTSSRTAKYPILISYYADTAAASSTARQVYYDQDFTIDPTNGMLSAPKIVIPKTSSDTDITLVDGTVTAKRFAGTADNASVAQTAIYPDGASTGAGAPKIAEAITGLSFDSEDLILTTTDFLGNEQEINLSHDINGRGIMHIYGTVTENDGIIMFTIPYSAQQIAEAMEKGYIIYGHLPMDGGAIFTMQATSATGPSTDPDVMIIFSGSMIDGIGDDIWNGVFLEAIVVGNQGACWTFNTEELRNNLSLHENDLNNPHNVTVEQLAAFVKSGANAKQGLVPKPPTTAGTTKYLREDGTWVKPPDNNTTYTAGSGLELSGTQFNHANSIQADSVGDAGANRQLAFGGSFNIPKIDYDSEGHIFDATNVQITLPAAPTIPTLSKGTDKTGTAVTVTPNASKKAIFTAMTDTSVSGHTVTDTNTIFTLDLSGFATTGELSSAMVFKGTLGTNGTYTTSTFPAASTALQGDTYKVITAGTYRGVAAKVGDVLVCDGSAWVLIPSGDEPSGTVTNIATGLGLDGGPITSTGTISVKMSSTALGASGALGTASTASKIYGVQPDKDGNLAVHVPWSNTTYSAATTSAAGLMSAEDKTKLDGIAAQANKYSLPTASSTTLGGVKIGSNIGISSGVISVPTATKDVAGVTVVYPAANCTTFTSDAGTCTPLAVQKAAKQFAITRPESSTNKAIVRYSNTTGDVQDSKIIIEDVTNTADTSKKAQVIAIPAEGGKKMVYGYCTDQVDGTSFIGGIFDANATSYPYASGLAIGGTSGNLLWKGKQVATKDMIPSIPSLSGGSGAANDATVAAGVTVSGHAVTVPKKTLTAGTNINITGGTSSITIGTKYDIQEMSLANYNALTSKDSKTIYLITS